MSTEKTTHATTTLCKTALLLKDDVISGKIVNWYETGDPLTVPMLKKIIKVAEQFRLDQAATPPHAWGTFLHEHETPGDAFFFRTLDLDDRFEDSAFPGSIQRMVKSLSSYDVMYTELKRLIEEKASQSANKSGDKELIKNALESLSDFCRAYAFFNASAYVEILNAAIKEDHLLMKSTVMAYAIDCIIDIADINSYHPNHAGNRAEHRLLNSTLDFIDTHIPNHIIRNGSRFMRKLSMNRHPRVLKSWIDRFGFEDNAKLKIESFSLSCFSFNNVKLASMLQGSNKNQYWEEFVSAIQSIDSACNETQIKQKIICASQHVPSVLINLICLYPDRFPLTEFSSAALFEVYQHVGTMMGKEKTPDVCKQALHGLQGKILEACPDLIFDLQIEEGIDWKLTGIEDESYWQFKEKSAPLERAHIFHQETQKLNSVAEQARGTKALNPTSKRGIRKV